jgi:predicted phosphohydrolase
MIYKNFIKDVSERYEKVFLIRGNHEIYGSTLDQIDSTIKEICESFKNVIFLQRNVFDIEETNIRVIGATLWTSIKEEEERDIRFYISDFRFIRNWSIERHNQEHEYDVNFLKREIKNAEKDNKTLLIITHHAPYIHDTQPKAYVNSDMSSAFIVDMSFLFSSPNIHTWVYGHTHFSNQQKVQNVQLISNQKGYVDEDFDTNFNPLFCFEI